MQPFVFSTTKSILSEVHAVQKLPELCASLGIFNPLFVTDKGVLEHGLLSPVLSAFDSQGLPYVCFDKVVADPPDSIINEGVSFATKAEIDGVIGFGGGSSLDSAKLIALLCKSKVAKSKESKPNQQLADIYGVEKAEGERLPLILIPTTAGTGSEVTPIAIVTTGETTKAGIVSTKLLPDLAVLDASLTMSLPSHVTAATGIDAMVHAIEAYTGKIKKNPISDTLAKSALELLTKNIRSACSLTSNHMSKETSVEQDLAVRQNMLLGACLAGQAFANSPVGAVHALAYPLGGQFHIPHGLSNAIVLCDVMQFNMDSCAGLYAELAEIIIPAKTEVTENSPYNAPLRAQQLIDYLRQLIAQLGLPSSLQELGIEREQLESLAIDAMKQERLLVNNPKTLSLEDAMGIYLAAWEKK